MADVLHRLGPRRRNPSTCVCVCASVPKAMSTSKCRRTRRIMAVTGSRLAVVVVQHYCTWILIMPWLTSWRICCHCHCHCHDHDHSPQVLHPRFRLPGPPSSHGLGTSLPGQGHGQGPRSLPNLKPPSVCARSQSSMTYAPASPRALPLPLLCLHV